MDRQTCFLGCSQACRDRDCWMQPVGDTGCIEPRQSGSHKLKAAREATRSGYRVGSRTAISAYAGSLPTFPEVGVGLRAGQEAQVQKSVVVGERAGSGILDRAVSGVSA